MIVATAIDIDTNENAERIHILNIGMHTPSSRRSLSKLDFANCSGKSVKKLENL